MSNKNLFHYYQEDEFYDVKPYSLFNRSKTSLKSELFLHYDPIDLDLEVMLRDFVRGLDYPLSETILPKSWDVNTKSAMTKLLLALDGYLISVDFKPFIPLHELLDLSCSVNGQKKLKKFRKDSFLNKFKLSSFTDISDIKVNCIGDVFNYRYAINYNIIPEDYKLGLIDVNISDRVLEEFVDNIIIPDGLDLTDEDIQFELEMNVPCTSSMCIDNTFDYKSVPTYKNSFDLEEPSLDGKRITIPLSAENVRDTVMFTKSTSSYIRTLDSIVNKLWLNHPWFTMIKDKNVFLKRVEKFREIHSFFVCFDFEKEGITKPRILIIKILEALYEKYNLRFFKKCIDLYSRYNLFVDGETIEMKRGHGLGMANSLTSVVIITLLSMLLSRIQESRFYTAEELDFDVLSFNDDTTISIKEDYFVEFEEEFYDLCSDLSVRYKREKTFWGNEFVFCEEYSNKQFNNKDSYYCSALMTSLMCQNVTQAKQFVSSINFPKVLDKIFYFVVQHFGAEFYEEEFLEPIAFGGWFSRSIFGVETSFYDKTQYTQENLAACLSINKEGKRIRATDHPFFKIDDEPFMFSLPKVERLHGRRYIEFWNQTNKMRKQSFEKYMKKDLNVLSVYKKYRGSKLKDILPPKFDYVKKISIEDTYNLQCDIWRSKKPLSDYLLHEKAMSFLLGDIADYKRLSSFEIKERIAYLISTTNLNIRFEYDNKILTHPFLEMSYWRPERVIMALRCLNNLEIFEIPYVENEVVRSVKEKYGIEISNRFFELLEKIGPIDPFFPFKKLSLLVKTGYEIDELYNALFELHVLTTQELAHATDSEDNILTISKLIDFSVEFSHIIIKIKWNEINNQLTESHDMLRRYIEDLYYQTEDGTWVNPRIIGVAPTLNLRWYNKSYAYVLQLINHFSDEPWTGFFEKQTIIFDGKEIVFFKNLISIPETIYSDTVLGSEHVGDTHVDAPNIIIEEAEIRPDDDERSEGSDDMNQNDAFDFLENL